MFDLQAALATGKHKQQVVNEMFDHYIKEQEAMEQHLAELSAQTQAILDYAKGNEWGTRKEVRNHD